MTVKELIEKLKQFPEDMVVTYYDNEYGVAMEVESAGTQDARANDGDYEIGFPYALPVKNPDTKIVMLSD